MKYHMKFEVAKEIMRAVTDYQMPRLPNAGVGREWDWKGVLRFEVIQQADGTLDMDCDDHWESEDAPQALVEVLFESIRRQHRGAGIDHPGFYDFPVHVCAWARFEWEEDYAGSGYAVQEGDIVVIEPKPMAVDFLGRTETCNVSLDVSKWFDKFLAHEEIEVDYDYPGELGERFDPDRED